MPNDLKNSSRSKFQGRRRMGPGRGKTGTKPNQERLLKMGGDQTIARQTSYLRVIRLEDRGRLSANRKCKIVIQPISRARWRIKKEKSRCTSLIILLTRSKTARMEVLRVMISIIWRLTENSRELVMPKMKTRTVQMPFQSGSLSVMHSSRL